MAAVSEAFAAVTDRQGLVIGVLKGFPGAGGRVVSAKPNPWVEVPIRTHLALSGSQGADTLSRNHVNVLTADVVVALPGGEGTRSEVELAVRYAKPVVAFPGPGGLPENWPPIPVAATFGDLEAFLVSVLGRIASLRARDP